MDPPNAELADRLAELAALLRLGGGDRFRVRAYERAARVVRAAPLDLAALDDPELRRLEGIGPAIAGIIAEHTRTGRIALLDELRAQEPPGSGALLGLPLLGVRDARLLAGTHGFTGVAALRAAAAAPGGLDALGDRLAGRVRESLRRLDATAGDLVPLPLARREAAGLRAALAAVPGVLGVRIAGAVRRAADTVGTLDLLVVTERPAQVARELPRSPAVVRVLERRDDVVRILPAAGSPADLWPAAPGAAGGVLLAATGSPAHLAALRARAGGSGGLPGGRTEAGVYAALGLPLIPPELREGAGEIAAAEAGALPRLVDVADLRGDLHVHSDWSRDGRDGLDRIAAAAAARGLAYVAVTDHAEDLAINGMSRDAVLARRRALAEVQQRHPQVRLLDAAELNIGLDGGLDYDPEFLLAFDLCVASVHSHMDRSAAAQTDRILAAIASPAVTVIGHPTGRILGHRPGYAIELEAIAQAAAATGTALEVNGSPRRLDLSAEMVRIALGAGATLALSSDAHAVGELAYLHNAVATARRGWATPRDIVNTGPAPVRRRT